MRKLETVHGSAGIRYPMLTAPGDFTARELPRMASDSKGEWGWPRGVLFDFDGTLADAYEGIAASINHVRRLHGLAPLPLAEVRRHVGRGPQYLLHQTVPGVDQAAALADYRTHHAQAMKAGTRLLPGAAAALTFLRQAGLPVAICSNKPGDFTRELVAHLGLADCVNAVLGPEDVPRLKPAPDMLQAALARLGLVPADALYVGDMVVDIEAARAAGVPIWAVPTGSDSRAELDRARPDKLLDSLNELTALLRPTLPA